MDVYDTNLEKLNENTPLAVLAREIRRLDGIQRGLTRNALRVALDEGDVLTLAKLNVGQGRWKSWRVETCPKLAERTDVLYRRPAAHRARIEQELAVNPDFSIREAAKLISVPKARPARPKLPMLEKWRALSAAEKTAGLNADGVDALLEILPAEWRDELADRVERVRRKTSRDRGLSKLLREDIKNNPESQLAKYVDRRLIDPQHLVVHVDAIDAPSRRRPPLVDAQEHARANADAQARAGSLH
jgi:hypothetical protein